MHHEPIPEDAVVDQDRYKGVFTHLWEAVHLKCPEIWMA
jgi:hypothetical protein